MRGVIVRGFKTQVLETDMTMNESWTYHGKTVHGNANFLFGYRRLCESRVDSKDSHDFGPVKGVGQLD